MAQPIWDEAYLLSKLADAERDAVNKVDYLFYRFTLGVTAGTSTYQLPSYVRKIERITWLGYKVWPVSWNEMRDLSPTTAIVSEGEKYESASSKPLYWCLHPNEYRTIQFYPSPNQTIAADTVGNADIYGSAIASYVIVSCFRSPSTLNEDLQLPRYVARRTKKAFALKEAFLIEGKGQNVKASDYYDAKYNWEIENFKKINNGVFVSRRPQMSERFDLKGLGRRPARPILPPDYPKRSY